MRTVLLTSQYKVMSTEFVYDTLYSCFVLIKYIYIYLKNNNLKRKTVPESIPRSCLCFLS